MTTASREPTFWTLTLATAKESVYLYFDPLRRFMAQVDWRKEENLRPNLPRYPQPPWTPPPPATPKLEIPRTEPLPNAVSPTATNQTSALLGPSLVMQGELTATEDLFIEGQFEGTINLQDRSLIVGTHGQVKGQIYARAVIIQGTFNGKITATENIEIRKTGHVVGDLVTAGVAINEGAYFKGTIEILREDVSESRRVLWPSRTVVSKVRD